MEKLYEFFKNTDSYNEVTYNAKHGSRQGLQTSFETDFDSLNVRQKQEGRILYWLPHNIYNFVYCILFRMGVKPGLLMYREQDILCENLGGGILLNTTSEHCREVSKLKQKAFRDQ